MEKHHFNVAFTFIDWESTHDADISAYGEVKAYYKRWGHGEGGTQFHEIPFHTCTREELGLEGDSDKYRFWPMPDHVRNQVESYGEQLKCMEHDIEINGDYNSETV